MTVTTEAPTSLVERVRVAACRRLSPSFVRLELTSPALADLADGPWWDQRFKAILPAASGRLPQLPADDTWYDAWCALPEAERGQMRTYTVRDVVEVAGADGVERRLVVDIVLHPESEDHPAGPGASFAATAAVGDELVIIAPRRGVEWGGIEWAPGDAERLLLVGDETAVPAIAAILEQLADADPGARGAAYLEVPYDDDVQQLRAPAGVDVTWIARRGAVHGERLHAAVVTHLGGGSVHVEVADSEVDPDLWETPVHSASGEPVEEHARPVGTDLSGLYAWIAGEAKAVTGLRRVLVRELGVDRSQVAFMGYWRIGVAMKG